jgi:4-amino-4-deoxy-L-arabinose transferase-like glycosyltransferase
MNAPARDPWLVVFLAAWAVLAVASIWLRPLWPVDETRYASVAWEMWLRGDFLVPYINGEPYSHKPPLLFWLIQLGWAVFGVNDWWPRLVAPLCAFAALPLIRMLARLLWPEEREHENYAAWALFGTILFAAFVTLVMFDLLLLLAVMVAMIGVLRMARGEMRAGILWLGAGIGLGVLAKGPVILLHVLPVAVVAPWWAPAVRAAPGKWYLGLLAESCWALQSRSRGRCLRVTSAAKHTGARSSGARPRDASRNRSRIARRGGTTRRCCRRSCFRGSSGRRSGADCAKLDLLARCRCVF